MRSYGTEMSYKSSLMSVIFQLQSVTEPPAPPMTELASGHSRCQDSCGVRCLVLGVRCEVREAPAAM